MQIIKTLFILIFTSMALFATVSDNLFFLENENNKNISLKDEFLKPNSKLYTISIAALNLDKTDPIKYFKKNGLSNTLAYKFGEEKKYAKVIYGVFNSEKEAKEAIKNLPETIKRNKPYVSRIVTNQNLFNKKNKKENISLNTKSESLPLVDIDNLIYISDTKEAKALKKEFLNESSKYFSISIATIDLKTTTIEKYFKKNNISNKALAHIFGKNKDKARVIYGLYKTRSEATQAINELNKTLRANKPFAMKMAKFQSFYKKNLPKDILEKENKKEEKTKTVEVAKADTKIGMQTLLLGKNVDTKDLTISKKDKNILSQIKSLNEVYYIDNGNVKHSIKKEFLNSNSTFYTIDFGEIDLNEISIKEFLAQNSLKNNVLIYRYGDKKEYARVLYGAYETREDSNDAIENMKLLDKGLRVTSIRNHQILYKIQNNIPLKDEVKQENN